MAEIGFANRVVIVTGGGGAIGGALLTIDPSFATFYISMAVLLAVSLAGVLLLPRSYGDPSFRQRRIGRELSGALRRRPRG